MTTVTDPRVTAGPMISGQYGDAPLSLDAHNLAGEWIEFLHYLYLPVRLPKHDGGRPDDDDITLPRRLEFLRSAAYRALDDAIKTAPHLSDPYVYVTARRGYASPGNPLNRPGWHCDDFGGTDLNYIWTDRYPTRFLTSSNPLSIPEDDHESMATMERLAHQAQALTDDWHQRRQFNGNAERPGMLITHGPSNTLLRLSPYVIHATPAIPDPGGVRSFFKISVSSHRYDLVGNSHNYDLDYDWPMVGRDALRNQPASATATSTNLSPNRTYIGANQ